MEIARLDYYKIGKEIIVAATLRDGTKLSSDEIAEVVEERDWVWDCITDALSPAPVLTGLPSVFTIRTKSGDERVGRPEVVWHSESEERNGPETP